MVANVRHLIEQGCFPHPWYCKDGHRPILLGKYNDHGIVKIKARDRWIVVSGQIKARCPQCGQWIMFEPDANLLH